MVGVQGSSTHMHYVGVGPKVNTCASLCLGTGMCNYHIVP